MSTALRGRLEAPETPPATLRQVLADLEAAPLLNGAIGFPFAASGPVAVILAAGAQGGLSAEALASWMFGVFVVNGLITIGLSCLYRTPLVCFWTIPGAVLVGATLTHATLAEVVGAYLVTGALMAVLGLSGWVRDGLARVPMPIVMGMVAGVFLRFGLDLVRAVHLDPGVAGPMVLAFAAASAWPALGRRLPPVFAALIAGALALSLAGDFQWPAHATLTLTRPQWVMPVWSSAVLLELVVPLAITVLVVQNGQGFAVLRAAGHRPPVNAVTLACGLGSMAVACLGAVSTCLTGPTNALVTASGTRSRQYTGAVFVGVLAMGFGLLASGVVAVMLALPRSFIAALAGLAMLRVLQAAFTQAFRERFALGALCSLLVTVADLPVAGIGAPFWGLVVGVAASWVFERADFQAAPGASPTAGATRSR